jgi:hypothetical protein
MKINKQAWHFHLASFGNDYIKSGYYESDYGIRKLDFCLYVRAILKGALLYLLLSCVVTGAAWCVVSTVLWLVVSIQYRWFDPPIPASIFLGVVVAVIAMFAIRCLIVGSQKVADVGPVREAYKAWKGKYCPLVTLD